jgi:ketosteroid isomerase-like protein
VEDKENSTYRVTRTLSNGIVLIGVLIGARHFGGMNMRSILISGIFSFFLAAAFPQSPAPTPRPKTSQQDSLEKQLRDADLAFAKATAERRLEGWMEYFAADAAILQDGKTITGTQSLRAYYEPLFANQDFSLSWTPTKAEASKDGTLGYTYGDYEAKRGGKTSRGMYLTIWRKEGGRWKVIMDTGSSPAQQPKEAKTPSPQ